MNKKENEENSELKDLLEELSQLDTPEKATTDNKPWWLQEENLLGEVDLDYNEIKLDTKPLLPDPEINVDKENGDIKSVEKVEVEFKDREITSHQTNPNSDERNETGQFTGSYNWGRHS